MFTSHFAALALAAALFAAASARASDLVGPESCRSCHAEAYRVWSQGPHARAASALDRDQRRSPLCLYCHSRDEARSGAAQVTSVSCETCHGGGRFYQPSVVMRDRELARLFGLADLGGPAAEASCQSCHGGDSPSLKPFDFKEALTRIDHWTADRAARKGARERAEAGAPRNPHDLARTPHLAAAGLGARPAAGLASWLRQPTGPERAP